MNHLVDAHAFIEPIAAARRNRGRYVADEHLERAAALLTDLWAAAVRHGITPAQPGYHTHLPRAAFDSITAAIRTEHGWTIHSKHLRRRLTNPLTEAMQDFLVTDPTHTRRLVAELTDDRRAHGRHMSSGQTEQAAALPADLWAAAARPGITLDHLGYRPHLSRAALDTISAPPRRPPASRRPPPLPWQHRQGVDR